ncbi:MAG: hypothetical protein ACRDB0_05570 [Paraclostridium sp.]
MPNLDLESYNLRYKNLLLEADFVLSKENVTQKMDRILKLHLDQLYMANSRIDKVINHINTKNKRNYILNKYDNLMLENANTEFILAETMLKEIINTISINIGKINDLLNLPEYKKESAIDKQHLGKINK